MTDTNKRADIRQLDIDEVAAVSGGAKNYRDPQQRPWAVFDLDTGDIGGVGCGGIIVLNGKTYVGGYNGPIRIG